jgi:hypothetical protein
VVANLQLAYASATKNKAQDEASSG